MHLHSSHTDVVTKSTETVPLCQTILHSATHTGWIEGDLFVARHVLCISAEKHGGEEMVASHERMLATGPAGPLVGDLTQ
jgi:hypothetical protein